MKKRAVLFFTLLLSFCSKNFQDKAIEIDNEGRTLGVSIVYPQSNLNTSLDQVSVICQASDKIQKIKQVEVKLNESNYEQAQVSDELWKKTYLSISLKNNLCARITSNIGGIKEVCSNFYKTLTQFDSASNPFKLPACAYWQDRIYCAGGEGNDNNLLIYHSQTGKLLSTVSMGIDKRLYSSAAVLNGNLYILGGLDGDDLPVTYYLVYSIASGTWDKIYPSVDTNIVIPPIRVASSAIALKEKICQVGGGSGYPGLGVYFYNSVECYDPSQITFVLGKKIIKKEILSSALNYPRAGFVSVTDGRYIWAAGGYNETDRVLNSLEVYDFEHPENGWKMLPSMNQPRFLGSGALIKNRYFYLFGGINFNERLKNIERFDVSAQKWEITGETDYILTESGYSSDGTSLFLAGGVNKNDEKISSFYRFTPYFE